MYSRVYYRLIALLLLPALLSGCSVYDHFFHPHRLGTPPMSDSAKAKARAADKARHKGLTLGTTEATGNTEASGSADGAAAPTPAAPDKAKAVSYGDLSSNIRNTYDKRLLLKRSKLQRMEYSARALHHYDLSPPAHSKATREERKLRKYSKHPKGKGTSTPDEPAPREPAPAPDPTQPAPPPAAKATAKPLKAAPKPATAKPAAAPAPPAAQPAPAAAPDEPPLAPARSQPAKKSKKGSKEPKPDPTQPHDGN